MLGLYGDSHEKRCYAHEEVRHLRVAAVEQSHAASQRLASGFLAASGPHVSSHHLLLSESTMDMHGPL